MDNPVTDIINELEERIRHLEDDQVSKPVGSMAYGQKTIKLREARTCLKIVKKYEDKTK